MLLPLLFSCVGDGDDSAAAAAAPSCETGVTYIGVVDTLLFTRAEGTVSDGFDLDGVTSSAGGSTGCGVADYTSPRGVEGVDNGMALLVPALEATEAVAVEGLIQDAIHSGELLMMFQLRGVDDLYNDDCVGFTFERGAGTPLMGTDGALEWYQTFDRDPTVTASSAEGLSIVDGRFEVRDIAYQLPISVLDVDLLFEVEAGAFALEMQPDGSYAGAFAGGLSRQALLDVAYYANVDDSIGPLIESLLSYASDLDRDGDGTCEEIAATFSFTAIPAFFYADSPPPG